MNRMERVLSDDLARLIDRLAASIPDGAFDQICTTTPTLRARLDQLEATLAATHGALVETYGRWAQGSRRSRECLGPRRVARSRRKAGGECSPARRLTGAGRAL